jgi:hypothetical protein
MHPITQRKAAASRAVASGLPAETSVTDLSARRSILADRLDIAQTAARARQRDTEWALINADAEDVVKSAEDAASDAARRVQALTAALKRIDEQLSQARAEADRARDHAKRIETAKVHETNLVALKATVPALVEALNEFAEAGAKLDPLVWDIKSLNNIAGTLAAELPDAVHRVSTQAEWQIGQILRGETSASLGTSSPSLTVVTAPTMEIYTVAGIKWREPSQRAIVHHRRSFSVVDLPVALAERAVAMDAALPLDDVQVAVHRKTQVSAAVPIDDCKWIDGSTDADTNEAFSDDIPTRFKV